MDSRGHRVAVVMGGVSEERAVSLQTGLCVAAGLGRRHRVKPVEILADGRWRVPAGFGGGRPRAGALPESESAPPRSVLEALAFLLEEGTEVIFNALHGPGGEDGSFQGLLSHVGIPFTGPEGIPAAVTMDKCFAKDVLRASGLPTPRFFRVPGRPADPSREAWRQLAAERATEVPLPWVVKPSRLGSSVGVELIDDAEAFAGWAAAREGAAGPEREPPARREEYLAEERVAGRELTCAVISTTGEARALPPIEIRPRGSEFFDYDAKYTPGASEELCPAPLPKEATRALQDLALRVHRLFGCDPLSRTDVFLLPDGEMTVLEVNTLPGMTRTSLVPLSAAEAGIELEDLFDGIVDHALRRAERQGIGAPPLPARVAEST